MRERERLNEQRGEVFKWGEGKERNVKYTATEKHQMKWFSIYFQSGILSFHFQNLGSNGKENVILKR